MIEEIRKRSFELEHQLKEWRRDFHRRPEIAFEEKRTAEVLTGLLEALKIPVTRFAGTGLRGILEGLPGGPTVALRADMDGLPLQEEGNKPCLSEIPGAAHVCGHDGHMAILLGVAKMLSERRERFKGRVIFLFQPSEELPPGGAKPMVGEGVLDGVDAVFGLHLWQALPTGKVGIVKGPMMAAADNFKIKVIGRGGHGSMPHETVDPILAASQIVVQAQSIVSRSIDPLKPAVVSFGTFHGGTIYNIIPGEVHMTGTVRTFDEAVQNLAADRLETVARETCRAFGAELEFTYEKGYPAMINDPCMADFVLETVRESLGEDSVLPIDPVMGGEDFAYFLQKVPGAFLFFGMGDGMDYPHHHPQFDIDERALPQAAFLMTRLALRYLAGETRT